MKIIYNKNYNFINFKKKVPDKLSRNIISVYSRSTLNVEWVVHQH